MGHKVNPYGFRLGVIYPWKSNWYADRDYAGQLHEDIWIRKHIRSRLSRAGISSIDIERKGDQIWVFIRTARPGIVIGRKGAEVDRLRKDIERFTKKRVDVKVEDMNQAASESRPETDAALLAKGVAEQLAGRVACAGRLGGAEMGRREWYREGRVPLHTLRAKVDFGTAEARTTFGQIGVKVWVYHGDEVPHREQETERALARAHASAAQVDRAGRGPAGDETAQAAEELAQAADVTAQGPEPMPPADAPEVSEIVPATDVVEVPTADGAPDGPPPALAPAEQAPAEQAPAEQTEAGET